METTETIESPKTTEASATLQAPSPEVARAAGDLRAFVGRLARRLRQTTSVGDLTLSQASVLSLLEREGSATPGTLATTEHISPQSMGAIISALEIARLVSRSPDPNDGRCLVVSLTTAGREMVQGARRHRDERLADALANHFTPQEQQLLIAALPILERLTQVL